MGKKIAGYLLNPPAKYPLSAYEVVGLWLRIGCCVDQVGDISALHGIQIETDLWEFDFPSTQIKSDKEQQLKMFYTFVGDCLEAIKKNNTTLYQQLLKITENLFNGYIKFFDYKDDGAIAKCLNTDLTLMLRLLGMQFCRLRKKQKKSLYLENTVTVSCFETLSRDQLMGLVMYAMDNPVQTYLPGL